VSRLGCGETITTSPTTSAIQHRSYTQVSTVQVCEREIPHLQGHLLTIPDGACLGREHVLELLHDVGALALLLVLGGHSGGAVVQLGSGGSTGAAAGVGAVR
jgi:hypothetical protein